MIKIITPLGKIQVLVDGKPYPHRVEKLQKSAVLCPDIDGRYKIEVTFIPDGREHKISCRLVPSQQIKVYGESDERFECVSFLSEDERCKVSIGIHAESNYYYDESGRLIWESEFDYDALYGESRRGDYNISYKLLPFTRTSHFAFGIAWLNHCVLKNRGKIKRNEHQTFFGAEL
ncbi:MAG: hypothetical protein E7211_18580 [Clostridium lundense]|nr:hypothetical protein [Clostridium lundense]